MENQIKDILGICIEPELLELKVGNIMLLMERSYNAGRLAEIRDATNKLKGKKSIARTFQEWINKK